VLTAFARFFAGPSMIGAGVLHFLRPRWYEAIMPDFLPAHRELIYASGVAEIAGGLGTLHPRTRPSAGLFLLAVLAGVYPANIHMALHPERYRKVPGGAVALYARLPVQFLMAYLVWVATQRG
jgi:uncharacterized membrane protein